MTQAYWFGQFILTAFFYVFAMFLWPSVVFHDFLRRTSRTYRFAFCTTGMLLLVNLVVLGMGLIPHVLHGWLTALLFYGVFTVQFIRLGWNKLCDAGRLLHRSLIGTMGIKSLGLAFGGFLKSSIFLLGRKCREFFRGHALEYGILIALCIYGVTYFSWNAFQMRFYGFGDIYVHHAWVDGLQHGDIFSSGIYPEGMHTFVYLLTCISGVRVYSILLFLAGIHSVLLLVSLWIFLRQIFHWKYTASAVVLLFLILEQTSIVDIYAMSRLQWTIPQEFGLFTELLCAAFLVRWLRGNAAGRENCLLFGMAVAASFATHFYVTILAVVLCVCIVLAYFGFFIKEGRWRKILLTGLLAVLIPLLPMLGAYGEGHPLQGSLNWAVEVMQGKDSDTAAGNEKETQHSQSQEDNTVNSSPDSSGEQINKSFKEDGRTEKSSGSTLKEQKALQSSIADRVGQILTAVRRDVVILRQRGFEEVYGRSIGSIYYCVVMTVLLVGVVLQILLAVTGKILHRTTPDLLQGGIAVSAAALLFMLDYAARNLGLPQIVADARVLTSSKMMILASLMTGPDFVYVVVARLLYKAGMKGKKYRQKELQEKRYAPNAGNKVSGNGHALQQVCGIVFLAGLSLFVVLGGLYHGYLYYEQSRYPEAVETTNRIIHQMDPETYTVVSTTDELYQVKQYGYHEELLTLVKSAESYIGYSLPTKYIFVYVEKKPLQYGQTHFGRGPVWLAVNGKNTRPYRYYHLVYSEGNDTVSGAISQKAAAQELKNSIGDSHAASELKNRVILESRAMKWIRKFQQCYPGDIGIFYEDNRFICYKIRQDPQIPYRMGFFAD